MHPPCIYTCHASLPTFLAMLQSQCRKPYIFCIQAALTEDSVHSRNSVSFCLCHEWFQIGNSKPPFQAELYGYLGNGSGAYVMYELGNNPRVWLQVLDAFCTLLIVVVVQALGVQAVDHPSKVACSSPGLEILRVGFALEDYTGWAVSENLWGRYYN